MVRDGLYGRACGTSTSAAFVTGVAALVWSRNPTWTASQVRSRLLGTAKELLAPATQVGHGRVDAYSAVYVPPYSASISGPSLIRPYDTCLYTASTTSPNSPYSYTWSVDGAPSGYSGPTAYHAAGGASFSLDLVLEDALGGLMYVSHFVTVDPGAPECLDS